MIRKILPLVLSVVAVALLVVGLWMAWPPLALVAGAVVAASVARSTIATDEQAV